MESVMSVGNEPRTRASNTQTSALCAQEIGDIRQRTAERRAWYCHAAAAAFTGAAAFVAVRRGRQVGFRRLFSSVSGPKDFLYIGVLYGAGDVSQQLVTQARKSWRENTDDLPAELNVDWKGVGTVTLVGASVFGPLNHYWYTFLDKMIRGRSAKTVLKKVIVDQLSLPIPVALFFVVMSVMRAKPDIFEDMKAKFLTTYLYGSVLWPTTQFFNFMFVPRSSRVLFIGFIELLWANVLCFMKDLEVDADSAEESLEG